MECDSGWKVGQEPARAQSGGRVLAFGAPAAGWLCICALGMATWRDRQICMRVLLLLAMRRMMFFARTMAKNATPGQRTSVKEQVRALHTRQ